MREIDEHNAAEYLREVGWITASERVEIATLAGGVSNLVLRVSRSNAPEMDFVFKQARPQLRVAEPWFCGVDRVWREVDTLHACQRLLADFQAPGMKIGVPQVLYVDRENYAFAMSAAPREHRVWRRDLLAGKVDPEIAERCGALLGRIHAASWRDPELSRRFEDRRVFDELRLDPYYRFVAQARPEAASRFERLIDDTWNHRLSLVHADFSPKNLLLYADGLLMVDFETGHFGDPAFDLGFFLSHLALKSFCRPRDADRLAEAIDRFWRGYQAQVAPQAGVEEYQALVARGIRNFAACACARIDGKSPVDYLPEPAKREATRNFCAMILAEEPAEWATVAQRLSRTIAELPSE